MQDSKKIWGIFNTFDIEKLNELSEYEVWKKINSLSNDIKCILKYSENPNCKDINIKALIIEQFNLEYLIYYTRKFGVEFEETPSFNNHIKQSQSFNKWYKFWQDYSKSVNLTKYVEKESDGSQNILSRSSHEFLNNDKESNQLQKTY